MATILVTGGCGYIGSHTVLELLNKNYEVVVVDNFSNSSFESLKRVQKITGKEVVFYEADIRDSAKMESIFDKHAFDAVIHFAAFKAVGESCKLPLKYYENNISGTVSLLQIMEKHGVKKIIFSSSATVYGDPERLPLDETCRLSTTNPYGSTKLMMENIMQDLWKADNEWNIILLRYFNPVGAHESGLLKSAAQNEEATKIKAYIDEQIMKNANNKGGTTIVQQATSPAEELKKMKELLDMGIITQEEFDAKKKQLLGL